MEDQSHEKETLPDSSIVHRLSESRPSLQPVLVKKLLAENDESDDDEDENYVNNEAAISDNSEEDLDTNLIIFDDDNNDNDDKKIKKVSVKVADIVDSGTEVAQSVEKSVDNQLLENLKLVDVLKKDSSVADQEKLAVSGYKRKSSLTEMDCTVQQRQPSMTVESRKLLLTKTHNDPSLQIRDSPGVKRHSHSIALSHISEASEKLSDATTESYSDLKKISRHSSTSDDKITESSKISIDQTSDSKITATHSSLNTTAHGVTDTPMKHLQDTTRPNPCKSHRNIFQTPQNKIGNEYAKNPIQTPATIFSLWSQKHMTQTPQQNSKSVVNESVMQTPVSRECTYTSATTHCIQSQETKIERPKYYSLEGKNVRRPLAATMSSSSVQGTQSQKLSEVSNKSHSTFIIKKDKSNAITHEDVDKKQSSSASAPITHETKENKNPQVVMHKSEDRVQQQRKLSFSLQSENKPKQDIQNNIFPSNSNLNGSKNLDSHESNNKNSKNVHPPVSMKPEQKQPIQYAKAQPSNLYNTRPKIITVEGQQYLVLSVIGQGMSCEVVRVQDLSNNDLRAIKCVNINKMDKESVEGCLQEILLLDKLRAPCIVNMYHFQVSNPWIHVVMEIGDTDLSRLLKSMMAEKKKLPLTMILYYWTEMLTAVKHIHENGVIHSDLKPANFLLVRGRLKLIDFGIASSINSDMTSVLKNCSIGTLNYVSPEALMDVNAGSDSPNQNVKYKISCKSDVWSLGCILYSLVYGVTPFNHIRQQWTKVSAIIDKNYKINFPHLIGNEPVPTILVDVMRKCLEREPKARPSVADLLEIPYLQGHVNPVMIPSIPSNLLLKIKRSLSDEEWKQFSEIFSNIR